MSFCVLLFEDSFIDQLRPINLARPTCAITVGACSLAELVYTRSSNVMHAVRPHLRPLLVRQGLRIAGEPVADVNKDFVGRPTLFINAALIPDTTVLDHLFELSSQGTEFVSVHGQRVAAAFVNTGVTAQQLQQHSHEWVVPSILAQRLAIHESEYALLNYSFDVMRHHEKLLPKHLQRLIDSKRYEHLGDHVYVGKGTEIAKHTAFDTSDGPILLGAGVKVKPFAYISGPVKVGDKSIINDHAAVKHASVLGHTVKLGGETEVVIIEPFSNKQHHGFLGHSYVGSWVNLGAGTSNSDLKNTYGEVGIELDGVSVPTGLQFVGGVIGDYTKSAINTSIFTGKLIGVASFLYGFVTTNVPSFTNYARSFGQVTEVGMDVAYKTQVRAAGRRNVELSEIDQKFFEDLFALTQRERQLSNEQITL